jgi:hypothetical protein
MSKEVFVVSTCDAWMSYDSFRLVGVFTSRAKLNPVLNNMLKHRIIVWDDDTRTDRFVNKLTDKQLHNELKYISVELITLNEVQ